MVCTSRRWMWSRESRLRRGAPPRLPETIAVPRSPATIGQHDWRHARQRFDCRSQPWRNRDSCPSASSRSALELRHCADVGLSPLSPLLRCQLRCNGAKSTCVIPVPRSVNDSEQHVFAPFAQARFQCAATLSECSNSRFRTLSLGAGRKSCCKPHDLSGARRQSARSHPIVAQPICATPEDCPLPIAVRISRWYYSEISLAACARPV
jgi:hypothetical protein